MFDYYNKPFQFTWQERLFADTFKEDLDPQVDLAKQLPPTINANMDAAIELLQNKQKKLIKLKYEKNMTMADVCNEMGIKSEKVRTILSTAYRDLQKGDLRHIIFMGKDTFETIMDLRAQNNLRDMMNEVLDIIIDETDRSGADDKSAVMFYSTLVELAEDRLLAPYGTIDLSANESSTNDIVATTLAVDYVANKIGEHSMLLFKDAGFTTYDEVMQLSIPDIMQIKGFGKITAAKVYDKLHQ